MPKDNLERMAMKEMRTVKERGPKVSSYLDMGTPTTPTTNIGTRTP